MYKAGLALGEVKFEEWQWREEATVFTLENIYNDYSKNENCDHKKVGHPSVILFLELGM